MVPKTKTTQTSLKLISFFARSPESFPFVPKLLEQYFSFFQTLHHAGRHPRQLAFTRYQLASLLVVGKLENIKLDKTYLKYATCPFFHLFHIPNL
jgi:hypothetical protein